MNNINNKRKIINKKTDFNSQQTTVDVYPLFE